MAPERKSGWSGIQNTSMRDVIVAQSSPDFYEFVLMTYVELREDIRSGRRGGATIYAVADS